MHFKYNLIFIYNLLDNQSIMMNLFRILMSFLIIILYLIFIFIIAYFIYFIHFIHFINFIIPTINLFFIQNQQTNINQNRKVYVLKKYSKISLIYL